MSLLLDALKKAAQKKAKKSGAPDAAIDSTEIEATQAIDQDQTATQAFDHEPTTTSLDETELNETSFDADATQVGENTQFTDITEMDSTVVDKTSIDDNPAELFDNTEVSSTLEMAPVPNEETEIDIDQTEAVETVRTTDPTEIDSTLVDKTEVQGTSLEGEAPELDESAYKLETKEIVPDAIDATEVESNQTEFTETVITEDSTHFDEKTQVESTEIDSSVVDRTEVRETSFVAEPTELDESTYASETMEITPVSVDSTDIESDQAEVTDNVNFSDLTEEESDPDMDFQSGLADEDSTLYFQEDEESDSNEAVRSAEVTETQRLYFNSQQLDEENLTEDDVTQFMGDGVSTERSNESGDEGAELGANDTTLTNPDSLTLTNYSFDDQESEDYQPSSGESDQADDETFSTPQATSGESTTAINDTAEIRHLGDVADDEKITLINMEGDPTASAVDIEKLTNEETVTVGSSTAPKTFAPDNYDRTLINLSEKDVSNIFPGMRPDSDTVMTPDYAKRIFLSKSSQANTSYYKTYLGIGIISLLSVVIWGLFQLQVESNNVEQSLASLKRDPMPGIIQSQPEKATQSLFEIESKSVGLKNTGILSSTDEIGSNEGVRDQELELASAAVVNEGRTEVDSADSKQTGEKEPSIKAINQESDSRPVKSETTPSKSLVLSSTSRLSRKDQLLMEAYEAYEKGDLAAARTLYDDVLAFERTDRDGNLGRAAIHVRDKEYQQAIDKYQQVLVNNPKDSMAMAALISVANIDPLSGETQLKSLLREQPDTPYLHFVLGNMYGSQNRWREAQNSYFDALQKKPDDPNYAYNLAVSLEHIGKSDAALTYYQKALDNNANGLVTFDSSLVMQRVEVLTQ